ncbi:zinc finger protein 143 [Clonorchis sinensis]|uniref:Zinc finger protein 143 n=1 Tax=Clonorchis sinensis TaxID=79923 RepID=G7YVX5_CLOSI|nr:zinc finger protein 143 [Clonorchis sinensis]
MTKSYRCLHPGCGKSFPWQSSLRNHRAVHVDTGQYTCPVDGCGRAFRHRRAFVKHHEVHLPAVDRPRFCCDFAGCRKSYVTLQLLQDHQNTHEALVPYVCNHKSCGRSFHSSALLTAHRRIHLPVESRMRVRCSVDSCTQMFRTHQQMATHRQKAHGFPKYRCNALNCGKEFTRVDSLTRHRERNRACRR